MYSTELEETLATQDELLDDLMKNYKKPEDLIGENGLLKQLTKALVERAMKAEMTEHLGYDKHDPAGKKSGNSRNGNSKKTIKGEFGNLEIEVQIADFMLYSSAKSTQFFYHMTHDTTLLTSPFIEHIFKPILWRNGRD